MSSKPWLDSTFELLVNSMRFYCAEADNYLRLSLICADNAFEIGLKTYVEHYLGKNRIKWRGNTIRLRDAGLFHLTRFLKQENKLAADEARAINHYHDVRNNLYHEGGTVPRKTDALNYITLAIKVFERLFGIDFDIIRDEDAESSLLIAYVGFVNIGGLEKFKDNDRLSDLQDFIKNVIPPTSRYPSEEYISYIDLITQLENE